MNELHLDPCVKYQTFERFGASGAWWAQRIGGRTDPDPETGLETRERIARLLFDPREGLGLRVYRYNLGSGSANSGAGRYSAEERRAESFDTEDGSLDFSRDANAVWMMKRAVSLGADEVVLFSNSPPERMTKNGKGYLDVPGRTNLSPGRYREFADYCLKVAVHFLKEGVPVRFLSPVNEPVWVWTENQEGCHYRPWQVRELMRVFAEEMDARPALKDVKLSGAENGDIRWFNKTYTRIMLDDPVVRARTDGVDLHSYCVTPDNALLRRFIADRVPYLRRYRAWMDRHYPRVKIKTSEWTHMQGGRDCGMDSALEQTKVLLEDLCILNVVSWQVWIAVSSYDYCDGLIYENEDGSFTIPKRYYAFGNFTRFLPPGARRFACDAGEGLETAAFGTDARDVVVVRNAGEARRLRLPALPDGVWVTDETRDLAPAAPEEVFTLSEKSVTTFVFQRRAER